MEEREHGDFGFDGPWWAHPVLRNALAAGVLAGAGFLAGHMGLITQRIENLFYWVAIPLGGYHWAREGLEKLLGERVFGIELLMVAATIGSGILGLWDEAAALVFLYSVAEGVEELTYARTRHAIRALLDLAPKEAHMLRDGQESVVPAASLRPGDLFIVRPGESIATDGIIVSGASSFDESPVTGESVPVDKGPGDRVFAASINRQGALTIQATTVFADNTLSKIIRLVEEAQERKGKAQQWIERFGRWYSPAVLAASLVFLLVPWVFGLPFSSWSMRAVVLLVAAAPCALIMSTPIAIAAGIGAAGKHGILIKGGLHLEHLGTVRVVAFDKTGTLTNGTPSVTDVVTLDGAEEAFLAVVAGLERFSEHPLARAILRATDARGIAPAAVEQFEAQPGAGAKGVHRDVEWFVGSPALFARLGVSIDGVTATVSELQEQAKTVVLAGTREKVAGVIALQDVLREKVPGIVSDLHAAGMRTVMLTGDNVRTAQVLARQAGIDDVRAELKPEQKVTAIQQLEKQYGPVLMVGDGVNDAPALAAATCGVAMGAVGTDAAIEAADVALMADDLAKLLEALRLGRKARRVSLQNIVFSVVLLAALIPLAVGGLISVAVAVLVHESSEILAVLNGLRVAAYERVAGMKHQKSTAR